MAGKPFRQVEKRRLRRPSSLVAKLNIANLRPNHRCHQLPSHEIDIQPHKTELFLHAPPRAAFVTAPADDCRCPSRAGAKGARPGQARKVRAREASRSRRRKSYFYRRPVDLSLCRPVVLSLCRSVVLSTRRLSFSRPSTCRTVVALRATTPESPEPGARREATPAS